jgi:hypothetical protein
MPVNTRLLYGSGGTQQADLPEEICGVCLPVNTPCAPEKRGNLKPKNNPAKKEKTDGDIQ